MIHEQHDISREMYRVEFALRDVIEDNLELEYGRGCWRIMEITIGWDRFDDEKRCGWCRAVVRLYSECQGRYRVWDQRIMRGRMELYNSGMLSLDFDVEGESMFRDPSDADRPKIDPKPDFWRRR